MGAIRVCGVGRVSYSASLQSAPQVRIVALSPLSKRSRAFWPHGRLKTPPPRKKRQSLLLHRIRTQSYHPRDYVGNASHDRLPVELQYEGDGKIATRVTPR